MRQLDINDVSAAAGKRWKTSQFNEYLGELKENTWVIYHNLSGAMIEVKKEVYESLLYNRLNDSLNPDFYKPLSYANFIVQSEVDEFLSLKETKESLNDAVKAIGLQILPTLGCNFKCTYCYEQAVNKLMSREVMDAVIEYIKNKIKPTTESLNVMWFGGEPLLHISCIQYLSDAFISLCRENKTQYSSFLVSNGYMLTPKYADILLRKGVRGYQVTMDGPEWIHDQRRMLANGGKTYRQIFNNLKYLTTQPYVNVCLRVNIDKTNIGYIEEFFQDLKAHGIFSKVSFTFGLVSRFGDACKSIEDTQLTVDKADSILEEKDIESLLKDSGNPLGRPMPDLAGCVASARNSLIIGPGGELYKCSKTIGNGDEIAGSIFNLDYEHPNMKKWIHFDNHNKPSCRKCPMLPVCSGNACPFEVLVENQKTGYCSRKNHHNRYVDRLKSLYYAKQKRVPDSKK